MGGGMKVIPGIEKIVISLTTEGEIEICQTWDGADDSPTIVIHPQYVDLFVKAIEEVAKEAQG
jgi:hypothetical protein